MVTVVAAFSRYHLPGRGFTYVLDFGEAIGVPRLPEVDALPVYVHDKSFGYDAQFYSQIALHPLLRDQELKGSIDNLPYRARRLLMGAVAWVFGGGDPWRVLNVFACLNLLTWLATAMLLFRWLPAKGLHEFLVWVGIMFSAGMLLSLRHALPDGPAVLVLLLAVMLLELKHPWGAAAVGALVPLTRETGVLGAIIFAPTEWRKATAWLRSIGLGVLMVAPFVVWFFHVKHATGADLAAGMGRNNFSFPFAAYFLRWGELLDAMRKGGTGGIILYAFLGHLALSVQAVWLLVRPRWSNAWWRVGAVHIVLMAMLGSAVWEGIPGAASRVLLPLTVSFNMLIPRTRWGLVLLMVGNLSIFAGIAELQPPPREIWSVSAAPAVGRAFPISLDFGDGFNGPESGGGYAWRWTSGDAKLQLENHTGQPLVLRIKFTMNARSERTVTVRAGGEEIWSGTVGKKPLVFDTASFELPVGGCTVAIDGGEPDYAPGDPRPLAVCVFGVRIEAGVATGSP